MSRVVDRFMVRVVVREVDDGGRVTGEKVSQEVVVFGVDGLLDFARSVTDLVENAEDS